MKFNLKKKLDENKSIIIYLITSAIVGSLSVYITTFLTNHLTTKEYGYIETFMSISALLTSLIMFGGSTFISSYNNPSSFKNEYHFAFILILSNTFILSFFSALFLFFSTSGLYYFVCFLILYSFLNSIYNLILTSFQLDKKVNKYAIYTVFFSLLSSLFTILSITFFKSFYARICSLIGALIFVTIFALVSFKYIKFPFFTSKRNVKNAYNKGFYLAVSQVFSWVLEKSDRLIILSLLNSSLLAIYGLGYQFGMLMLLFQSAVSKAWIPYLQTKIKLNERILIRKRILKISIFYFVSVILISFVAWFYIITFINKNYYNSIFIVPFVTLGYAFDGIWKLYNSIFIIEEKYKLFSVQIIIVGILNIVTTFFLVKYIGVIGAAISTALSFLIGLLWSYYYITFKLKWFISNGENK